MSGKTRRAPIPDTSLPVTPPQPPAAPVASPPPARSNPEPLPQAPVVKATAIATPSAPLAPRSQVSVPRSRTQLPRVLFLIAVLVLGLPVLCCFLLVGLATLGSLAGSTSGSATTPSPVRPAAPPIAHERPTRDDPGDERRPPQAFEQFVRRLREQVPEAELPPEVSRSGEGGNDATPGPSAELARDLREHVRKSMPANASPAHERARRELEAAIDFGTGVGDRYYQQAVADARQGRTTRALENVNRAISFNPFLADYYRLRAELYERRGERAKAAEDRRRADKLGS